ncbi:hypothetical protein [Agromyces archimandritae]|uniref:Uncharacterized protein n=1 Tax=Agromyces archimandritae TaxID=2781962 RepID=A0A975FMG1_9MICO|nr:hypothetical protein [Agromyces archimandritae]QTX03691.1 hypothetical protein G127AT_10125 [Agromyces archimandritae]
MSDTTPTIPLPDGAPALDGTPASAAAPVDGSPASAAASPAAPAGPRIRWAAILWGTVFAVIAAVSLAVLLDAPRRIAFAEWIGALSPGLATLYGVLILGGIVLLVGLLGLIRGAERRFAARRAAEDSAVDAGAH